MQMKGPDPCVSPPKTSIRCNCILPPLASARRASSAHSGANSWCDPITKSISIIEQRVWHYFGRILVEEEQLMKCDFLLVRLVIVSEEGTQE
jgi:hypothetical protein